MPRRPIPVRLAEPVISAADVYAEQVGVARSEALRRAMHRGLQELTRELGTTKARVTYDHTPTQELVLEVLAARHRLGEGLWTFSRRPAISAALDELAKLGLVGYDSGVVERTWKVWLTDAGRRVSMSFSYTPPPKEETQQ